MKTRAALIWLTCLCALPLLNGCGLRLVRADQCNRIETVDVPVPVYQALPDALTQPLPLPAPPAMRCAHADGSSAVCIADALTMIPALQTLLDIANADRARAALLSRAQLEPLP